MLIMRSATWPARPDRRSGGSSNGRVMSTDSVQVVEQHFLILNTGRNHRKDALVRQGTDDRESSPGVQGRDHGVKGVGTAWIGAITIDCDDAQVMRFSTIRA
jgi:hypothetical protein